jgi:hypothetical protein
MSLQSLTRRRSPSAQRQIIEPAWKIPVSDGRAETFEKLSVHHRR